MRRIVNLLQSLSLLENKVRPITAEDIYTFTGNPSPAEIESYIEILRVNNVADAFNKLEIIFKENGISMLTIVKEIYQVVLKSGMNKEALKFITTQLA